LSYQDGPLMLFVDTSAFLSMLGCPGSVASGTCLTLKLLQALAGSGRFGRGERVVGFLVIGTKACGYLLQMQPQRCMLLAGWLAADWLA
jgi:hypothetical protein